MAGTFRCNTAWDSQTDPPWRHNGTPFWGITYVLYIYVYIYICIYIYIYIYIAIQCIRTSMSLCYLCMPVSTYHIYNIYIYIYTDYIDMYTHTTCDWTCGSNHPIYIKCTPRLSDHPMVFLLMISLPVLQANSLEALATLKTVQPMTVEKKRNACRCT